MRAGADFVHFQQLQPAAMQQFKRLFTRQRLLQLDVATVVWIEVLVHTAEGNRVAVGFNLQNQLDEVAQLQRLPERFWRFMGDEVAVFGDGQQLVPARFACLGGSHGTGQFGKALAVFAHRFQHDINGFEKLLTVQIFQHRKVDA